MCIIRRRKMYVFLCQSKIGNTIIVTMAHISSLSFLSTINVSATSCSPSLFPPSQKSCHQPSKSISPKRLHVAKAACNGNNQDNLPTSPEGEQRPTHNNIIQGNRRDVLIGLGGLCGAATLTNNPFASAAPVAPDLNSCHRPDLPPGAEPTDCCPPPSTPTKVKEFEFPTVQRLKIRRPAHLMKGEELDKYKEAVRLMKALPDDDPRSFKQQANVHCAYCGDSYPQQGFPNLDLQVHFSWIFFPFHRWYLYFYERILGSLINDPNFALPFWNWDHPDGMEIPAIYTDRRSPLYHALRNANHQPPVLMDLNWNMKDGDTSGNVKANLRTMHRQVVDARSWRDFFGGPFRAGDTERSSGAGSLERVPHNIIHNWTGDITQQNMEDMGALYSAARDPIFYSHHANVDRMWSIWKSLGRNDIDDPDYLDSSFFFYDENRDLVSVKIRDCLDTRNLGYDYFPCDLPWRDTKPLPRRTKAQRATKPLTTETMGLPFTLNSIVSTVVKRPQKSRSKKEKEEKEETLVFEIQFDMREAVKFDVLINEEEDATFATPVNREFAGSFVNVRHARTSSAMATDTTFSIGISNLLDDLGADDDDSIVLTLVPQYGAGVIIKNIKIDYEAY